MEAAMTVDIDRWTSRDEVLRENKVQPAPVS